jgi:hypothetical protein
MPAGSSGAVDPLHLAGVVGFRSKLLVARRALMAC